MNYQQIKLVKDGNDHTLYYENEEKKIEQTISEDNFKQIFENLEPNFGFSLPDKMIQDFIKDGSILPSFKQSYQFTKEDFNELVDPFRNELIYINERENNKRRNIQNYIKGNTKKKGKKGKQEKKEKLLEKVKKKRKQKTNKEVKQKTNKKSEMKLKNNRKIKEKK